MCLLPVTMTYWDYDQVLALADGRVRIEGCDPIHFDLDIHDIFFRAIRPQEFDITELSFSSYMMIVSRGSAPYGVERNRLAIDNMTRYSHEQGLTPRKLAIEELFAPSTLQQSKS